MLEPRDSPDVERHDCFTWYHVHLDDQPCLKNSRRHVGEPQIGVLAMSGLELALKVLQISLQAAKSNNRVESLMGHRTVGHLPGGTDQQAKGALLACAYLPGLRLTYERTVDIGGKFRCSKMLGADHQTLFVT